MGKMIPCLVFSGMIFSLIFLQGCATTGYKKDMESIYNIKNIESIPSLKVVRYTTPDIRVFSQKNDLLGWAAFNVVSTPISFLPFGGIGGAIVSGAGSAIAGSAAENAVKSGEKIKDKTLPDFGQIVMNKFIQTAPQEIPNWPSMNVEEKTISEKYKYNSECVLEFKVNSLGIVYDEGFGSSMTMRMIDSNDKVLWQTHSNFYSNKKQGIDKLKADNCKLLKEEMEIAAEKIVSDFITHFKERK